MLETELARIHRPNFVLNDLTTILMTLSEVNFRVNSLQLRDNQ